MCQKEFDFELEKETFHGTTWDHPRSWNIYKGNEVDKAKLEVIIKHPTSKWIKHICFFLGHIGFYRRFIKDFSKIARPLTNLLAKDVAFIFDDKYLNA